MLTFSHIHFLLLLSQTRGLLAGRSFRRRGRRLRSAWATCSQYGWGKHGCEVRYSPSITRECSSSFRIVLNCYTCVSVSVNVNDRVYACFARPSWHVCVRRVGANRTLYRLFLHSFHFFCVWLVPLLLHSPATLLSLLHTSP